MQIFTVLRSGLYTARINGKKQTAHRTAILGSYSSQERADEVRDNTPVDPAWKDTVCTWVDVAILDEQPELD